MPRRRALVPAAVLALSGAVAVGGCSNPALQAAEIGTVPASCKDAKPKVGLAIPTLDNPYYVAMQNSFKKHAAEYGFEPVIQVANGADSVQIAQVQAMIGQQVCAVALNAVNSTPGASIVRILNTAGIPVFTMNVTIDPEALSTQHAHMTSYVGASNAAGGEQIAKQLLTDIDKGRVPGVKSPTDLKIGIIGNPDQTPTNERDKGFWDYLRANGATQLAAEPDLRQNGLIDVDTSRKVASAMISGNPDLNVIWADAGPNAAGALKAIQQSGASADKISLYAFCAADQPMGGVLKACAAQEPPDYAWQTLAIIRSYIDHNGQVSPDSLGEFKAGNDPANPFTSPATGVTFTAFMSDNAGTKSDAADAVLWVQNNLKIFNLDPGNETPGDGEVG